MTWPGVAVMVGGGPVRCVWFRRGGQGTARHGMAWLGRVRRSRLGGVTRGKARRSR